MRAFKSNPHAPPAASRTQRPAAPKRPKSGVQLIIAVVCGLWILSCTLWFCAAIYELIRFTLLQDAYGQHTSVFRTAYATSAAIAFVLGVAGVIVFFEIRRGLGGYRNRKQSNDYGDGE